MSEAFIVRRGGGGGMIPSGKFNFEVYYGIDTTELANPKQHDIFVVTDTPATKWQFNGVEPENPIEGMLWFVLNNNTGNIMIIGSIDTPCVIYCNSVMQMVDGEWVARDAFIYKTDRWIQFGYTRDYIFKSGIGFTIPVDSGADRNGFYNYNSEKITLGVSANGYCVICICSKYSIDVTRYSKMCIRVKCPWAGSSDKTYDGRLCVSENAINYLTNAIRDDAVLIPNGITSEQVVELDISNVSGNKYVAFWGVPSQAEYANMEIYDWWFE